MKKLVKSFKALILAAMMVSVLCVNAFAAQAETYENVSSRSFTFHSYYNYRTNYVSVRNYGPARLTVYDIYGHTWELAPNQRVSIGIGKGQTRKINMYTTGGTSKVYVAASPSEGYFD